MRASRFTALEAEVHKTGTTEAAELLTPLSMCLGIPFQSTSPQPESHLVLWPFWGEGSSILPSAKTDKKLKQSSPWPSVVTGVGDVRVLLIHFRSLLSLAQGMVFSCCSAAYFPCDLDSMGPGQLPTPGRDQGVHDGGSKRLKKRGWGDSEGGWAAARRRGRQVPKLIAWSLWWAPG